MISNFEFLRFELEQNFNTSIINLTSADLFNNNVSEEIISMSSLFK